MNTYIHCLVCKSLFKREHELEETCSAECQREKDKIDSDGFAELFSRVEQEEKEFQRLRGI